MERCLFYLVSAPDPGGTLTPGSGMADRERNVEYAVKSRTHWEDDADVLQCQGAEECPLGDGSAGVTFTMAIRKHHCRFCGKIFCYKCTPNNIKIRLTTTKGKKDFRACHACALTTTPCGLRGVPA